MDENNERPLLLNQSIKEGEDPSGVKRSIQAETMEVNDGNLSKSQCVNMDGGSQSPALKKKSKRYKNLQICSGVGLIIALIVIFAVPPLIKMVIIDQAKQQVTLNPSTQKMWAHIPGSTEVILMRNYTFHKLDNQGEFLFQNKKPIFRQICGFVIQELQDFLDIQYLDDGNFVKVRDWTHFQELPQSRSLDEKVTILNMPNLAYWSTLKVARPALLLQQGLALLFTSLEDSTIPTLIGTGVSQQFLVNFTITYSSFLSPAGISRENAEFIWSDPAYGLSDQENLAIWSSAATKCFENQGKDFVFSDQAISLKNHFTLTDSQTRILMQKIYGFSLTVRQVLLQNHYCAEIPMSECTGRYLGVAQLAEGWMTVHTPPVAAISPNDSICDSNVTCQGLYPQPYSYAKNAFKVDHQLFNKYGWNHTFTFPRETVLNWFNYNHSIQQGLNYNTAENCLLHIGNLDYLWEKGEKYEKEKDPSLLEPIMKRFGLESIPQTLVFWHWLRYMVNDFILQGGIIANLGVANLFTDGFYHQFFNLKDNLQRFLLTKFLVKELSKIECHDFFERALDEQNNPELINALCHAYPDTHSQEFAMMMVDTCERKYGKQWQTIRGMGVGLASMENLCDAAGVDNIGGRLHTYKMELDKTYRCTVTPNPYCSDFQLALLQWHNSTVTLNPPEGLPQLMPTTTFSQWKKDVKAVQYEHFIRTYIAEEQKQMFPKYNLSELFSQFTFQGIFSTYILSKQIRDKTVNKHFFKYVRYVSIYITLNGFTTTRSPRQILFGYEDEFLAGLKNTYPPFGGDPSAPTLINFNELNNTAQNSTEIIIFKTGKAESKDVFQNYEINGFKYLVNNYTFFNGNESSWEWRSPWAEDDYFYGTTAKIFAPNQFQVDNLSFLIPQIQRYGSNFFHNETVKTQKYGLEVYKGIMNKRFGQVSRQNDKYYQTFENIFNVTSLYGFPLYVAKNHFMDANEWLQRVTIISEDRSIHYKDTSEWDDIYFLIEPYTGVNLQSRVFLQNNFYHSPDILYDYPIEALLPVFSLSRGGNLTQSKFHQLYDPLILAFTIKKSAVYVGIGLAVIFVALFVFATVKKRKIPNFEAKSSQLGISLQEYKGQERSSVTQEMVRADQD